MYSHLYLCTSVPETFFLLPVLKMIFLFITNFELCESSFLNFLCILNLCIYSFLQIWKNFGHYFFQYFFCHTFSLLPYGEACYVHIAFILDHLKLSSGDPFIYFVILLTLRISFWIVSIDRSFSSWVFSFAISNLIQCRVFCISDSIVSRSRISVRSFFKNNIFHACTL